MSVLLEALKKAADEKKAGPKPPSSAASSPSRSALTQALTPAASESSSFEGPTPETTDTTDTDEPLTLLNQPKGQDNALSDAQAPTMQPDEEQSQSDAPLTLLGEAPEASAVEKQTHFDSDSALDSDSGEKAAMTPAPAPSEETSPAPPQETASKDSDQAAADLPPLKLASDAEVDSEDESESEALDLETRLALQLEQTREPARPSGADTANASDAKTPHESTSDSVPESTPASAETHSTFEEDAPPSATASSQTQAPTSSDQASLDWSLSQIPGYQSASDSGSAQDYEQAATQASSKKGSRWLKEMQSGQKRARKSYRWLWGVLLALLITSVLFAFGFFYFYEKKAQLQSLALPAVEPSSQSSQAAATASKQLSGTSSEAPVAPAELPEAIQPKEAATETEKAVAQKPSAPEETSDSADDNASANPSANANVNAKINQAQPVDAPLADTSSDEPRPVSSAASSSLPTTDASPHSNTPAPQPLAQQTQKTMPAETPSGPQWVQKKSRLAIEAKSGPNWLKKAFQAYQQQQWARAQQAYQAALENQPNLASAMMGLAAVAIKQDRYADAMGWYQRLLHHHPAHQKAQAAQAALATQLAGASPSLAQLQQWVDQLPDQAVLQTALGQAYAKKGAWRQAQTRFFKAYELDAHAGHTAHNLAVSLDHLGQYPLALKYYQRALKASGRGVSPEQRQTIEKRVGQLKAWLADANQSEQGG